MSAPLSLDAPVSILEFSLKPRKALKALRVRTLQDLLSLDVTRVQGLSGCGVGTVQQIEDARKWLAADIAALSHDQTDHISSEASEARFYQYVVRSLPSGVVPILEGFGIKTLLAFLRLTRDQARAIDGITYRTWQSIKRVQRMCRNRQAVFAAQYPQRLAGADGKSWPFDHLAATLSGKARHVLHLKGICTAANWLKLTEAEVLSIRGIGVGTWRELQRVRMRLGEDMPQVEEGGPFSETVIRHLPLFTGLPATVPGSALDEAFCPHDSVKELDLPIRAAGGLRDFGLRTIGELLCTPGPALKDSGNFGVGSLQAVQTAVLQHVLRRNGLIEEKPLDLTSWQGLVQDLLARCIRNDHERAALAEKRGLLANKPSTLKAVGQHRGLTRERIRQIVLAACRHLKSNQARRLAAPFLALVKDLVVEAGGIQSCDALAASVAARLNWREAPSGLALAGLLDALTGGEARNSGYVTEDSPCRNCSVALDALSDLVRGRSKVSLRESKVALLACCSERCPEGTASLRQPSNALVNEMLTKGEALHRSAALVRHKAMLKQLAPRRCPKQVTAELLNLERGLRLRPELSRQQAALAWWSLALRALGHEKRLAILYLLRGRPRSFAELAAATELNGQQLYSQLHVLRVLQLLTVRREGGCKMYGLNAGKATKLAGIIWEGADNGRSRRRTGTAKV